VRVHSGRGAAAGGPRRGRGNAPYPRHRGLRGHARRDALRHLPDASVLLRHRPFWGSQTVPFLSAPTTQPLCVVVVAPAVVCSDSGITFLAHHPERSTHKGKGKGKKRKGRAVSRWPQ